MIRVIVAVEAALVRQSLVYVLEQTPDILVVGVAADGLEVEHLILGLQPNVVLVDWNIPPYSGLTLAQRLEAVNVNVRLLLLGATADLISIQALLMLNIGGFLTYEQSTDAVLAAIRGVAKGETAWFNPLVERRIFQPACCEAIADLSERETAVMRLVAQGLENPAIAQKLNLSLGTVKNYITSSYNKLNVSSRAAAVAMFWRNGWICSDD